MRPRNGSKNKSRNRRNAATTTSAESTKTSPPGPKVVFNLEQNQVAQFRETESPHALADLLKKQLVVSGQEKEASGGPLSMQSSRSSPPMPIKSALSKKSIGSTSSPPSTSPPPEHALKAANGIHAASDASAVAATDAEATHANMSAANISKSAKKRHRKRKKQDMQAGSTPGNENAPSAPDAYADHDAAAGTQHINGDEDGVNAPTDTSMDTAPGSEPEMSTAPKKLIRTTKPELPTQEAIEMVAKDLLKLPMTLRKEAMRVYIDLLGIERMAAAEIAGKLSRAVSALASNSDPDALKPYARSKPQPSPREPQRPPVSTSMPNGKNAAQPTKPDAASVTANTLSKVSDSSKPFDDNSNIVWRQDSKIDVEKTEAHEDQKQKPQMHPVSNATPQIVVVPVTNVRSNSYHTEKTLVFDFYLKGIRAQDVSVKIISEIEARVQIASINKTLRIQFGIPVLPINYKISTGAKVAIEFQKAVHGACVGDPGKVTLMGDNEAASEPHKDCKSSLYTDVKKSPAPSDTQDADMAVASPIAQPNQNVSDATESKSSVSYKTSQQDYEQEPDHRPLVPVYMKRLAFEGSSGSGTPMADEDHEMQAVDATKSEDSDSSDGSQHAVMSVVGPVAEHAAIQNARLPPYDFLKRGTDWCGLMNEGVDCFINNIVQCLATIPDFSDYFLSGAFRNHINTENPISNSKGAIAVSFANLLHGLATESHAFVPGPFKDALERFWAMYDPYTQQDAQEFLNYLLDAIHEDVNKIHKKPYIELPDYDNTVPDERIAAEYWDAHKKRNDSIVVDSFQGQYKSQISCEVCHKSSVKFDAFMNLTMEIPAMRFDFEIDFAPLEGPMQHMVFSLPPNATIGLVRDKISRLTRIDPSVIYPFLIVSDYMIERLLNFPELAQNYMMVARQNARVVFFEIEPDRSYVLLSHLFVKRIPAPPSIDRLNRRRNLRMPMRRRMHRKPTASATKAPPTIVRSSPVKSNASSPADTDPEDNHDCANAQAVSADGVNGERVDDDMNDNHDENTDDGYEDDENDKENGIDESDESDNERGARYTHDAFGPPNVIDIDPGTYTLRELYEAVTAEMINRGLLSGLDIESIVNSPMMLFDLKLRHQEDLNGRGQVEIQRSNTLFAYGIWREQQHLHFFENLNADPEITYRDEPSPQGVLLDDCISQHLKEEVVDEWYCGNCKKHTRGLKKLDLWTLPEIVIVHLKRFVLHPRLQDWTKLDSHVSFPLEQLRLGQWSVNAAEKGKTYRLFAVSNHRGGTEHGHYTAFCKRQENWYHFDDETVVPVDADRVVTRWAYVLFYRLEQNDAAQKNVAVAASSVSGDAASAPFANRPRLMRDSSPIPSESTPTTVSPTETVSGQ